MDHNTLLARDASACAIQAMPLLQGKIAITSGTFTDVSVVECVSNGDITLTWADETTTTVSLTAPSHHTCSTATQVEVVGSSGTFILA